MFVTVSLGDIAVYRHGFHEGGAFEVSAGLYFGERQALVFALRKRQQAASDQQSHSQPTIDVKAERVE